MGFATSYLSRHKGFKPHINEPPSKNLGFAVTIPVYCEPDLVFTLESLWKCDRPHCDTEIYLVVNSPENADERIIQSNSETIEVVSRWKLTHSDPSFRFYVIEKPGLPSKDAGVGLARKTGMDEATYRFNLVNNSKGYILSMDADSLCDPNYFTAIEDAISSGNNINGFCIYFEHPLSGTEYPEKVYRAIADYELHLRYVNLFLRFSGFPYAHHTVGSCFGVRTDVYAAQGGMNKKKGGEDFYFLHKIIPLGNFAAINTTRVIPSPRESSRVPFGTGPAITRYLNSGKEMTTYAPDCFLSLQQLFLMAPLFYKIEQEEIRKLITPLPSSIKAFLEAIHYPEALSEINANSGSPESFLNRFYRWFDGFRIVKYLNYASREYYKQIPVSIAVGQLLEIMGSGTIVRSCDSVELLLILRKIERNT